MRIASQSIIFTFHCRWDRDRDTVQETNISHQNGILSRWFSQLPVWWDMYPFPGGYCFLQQMLSHDCQLVVPWLPSRIWVTVPFAQKTYQCMVILMLFFSLVWIAFIFVGFLMIFWVSKKLMWIFSYLSRYPPKLYMACTWQLDGNWKQWFSKVICSFPLQLQWYTRTKESITAFSQIKKILFISFPIQVLKWKG